MISRYGIILVKVERLSLGNGVVKFKHNLSVEIALEINSHSGCLSRQRTVSEALQVG
jgi:hypothetical protein